MNWIYGHLSLYRPRYLDGLNKIGDYYIPCYSLGDLRARLFGIRVPVLWALDRMNRP